MSTKLEDLSISDEGEEYMDDYDSYDEKENFKEEENEEENEEVKSPKSVDNYEIYAYIFSKVKDPILVGLIVFLFTNKLFLHLVNTIPMINIIDNLTGLNVFLSIIAAIIFFIMREFV